MKNKRKLFETMLHLTLAVVIGLVMVVCENPTTIIDPDKDTAVKPTTSPAAGEVASGTTVTLSTSTTGAEIWYTTNGSAPSKNGIGSIKYEMPIAITADLTIKAIALKDGMNDSAVLEAVYTIFRPIAAIYYEETEIPQNGTINAGEALITLSKNFTVEIRNIGMEVLNFDIANINITGDHAAAFTRTTAPGSSVSIGGSTSFVIQCSPTVQGENNAILTIPTNDSSRNPIVVYLKVTGVRGDGVLELSHDDTVITHNSSTPLDFGRVEVGDESTPLIFTIKNTGNIDLELTEIPALTSSNPVFAITQPTSTILSPEGTTTFTVQYIPTAEGEVTGTITIANNSDSGPFIFIVKGTGYVKRPQINISYHINNPQNIINVAQGEIIDAGQVLLTLQKTITVIINNTGEEVLTLDTANIAITGDNDTSFTKTTQPAANVSVGSQTQFQIICAPVVLGENTAVLTIPSNDINRNQAVIYLKVTGVQGHAIFELKNGDNIIENNSPTPFSLGQVIVGNQSPQYPFTIKNIGNIVLNLTGDPVIASSNPVFTVSLSPASTTLNPEASTEFRIRYTPTEEPQATGTITIENNSDEGTFSFTVTGRGYIYKPVVSIMYDDEEIAQNGTIDAGAVPISQSKPITITIKNMGDANLTIDTANITITGTDMAAFTKTTNPSVSVQDGNQTSFTISCSPIKVGENNATLTIPTNDPNRPNAIVNLKVTGGAE